ncbi:glycosyltransferase [Pararhodobacter sp. CCB-MM2]|uniref:glycosyltransferase n=1 Tax=Pararhodobacter sp. CCB-MM2 TaxID=1786003 RepID=UPI00083588FC|nr:glycosyltransferase [Pararhodobacter sp. CCB-MM2]
MAAREIHLGTSPLSSYALFGTAWLTALVVLFTVIPPRTLIAGDAAFLASMGMIGAWRWSWGGFHMLRAWAFTRRVFPAIRRDAEAAAPAKGRHVAVVCLSWKMGDAMNAAVYGNLFKDILDYSGQGTVVAAVASTDEMALIGHVHRSIPGTEGIRLAFTLQDGTGKRSAMADALAKLREMGVPPDCPGILMDGDTLVQPGTLRRTAPILLHQPRVGALTLDNTPLVAGTTLAREWYRLRMAQRHVYMSSMALSGRVLVLTGRWSMFRTQIMMHPNFAANLLEDVLHHKRLGKITMLTGDDKSTWRWVVENGWDVTYVPDEVIYCLESLPGKGFVADTVGLQKRWFGNMTRGGAKALKLGRKRLGTFTWLALMDQKASMWTPLFGLVFFGTAALIHDPIFLAIYALWICLTRSLHSAGVGLISGRWHPVFPLLTYYGQVVGAGIKIFVSHNPNVQRWTRQNTGGKGKGPQAFNPAAPRLESKVMLAASLAAFVSAVLLISNVTDDSARFDLWTEDLSARIIHGY